MYHWLGRCRGEYNDIYYTSIINRKNNVNENSIPVFRLVMYKILNTVRLLKDKILDESKCEGEIVWG